MKTRQIVLDTETTGLAPEQGHRIIEIGCLELVNRRLTHNNFQRYLQPDRDIEEGATQVHGIKKEFLADKPRFADIAKELCAYLQGAELIIHNAPFDVGFLDAELRLWAEANGQAPTCIGDMCSVTDTLLMARKIYPGQRNSLDALCKRLDIDQSQRTLHGALLDAELLANVYLAMTGGQVSLTLNANLYGAKNTASTRVQSVKPNRPALRVVRATVDEEALHQERLQRIEKHSGGKCVWMHMNPSH